MRASSKKPITQRATADAASRKSDRLAKPPRRREVKLSASPGVKEVRENTKAYFDAVLTKKQTFSVRSRGKIVCLIGPVTNLPKSQSFGAEISVTDIAQNVRSLPGAALHGPYLVTRLGKQIAVIYSSSVTERSEAERLRSHILAMTKKADRLVDEMDSVVTRMDTLLKLISQYDLVREGMDRRLQVRLMADAAIERRVQFLKENSAFDEASRVEAAFKKLAV